MMTLKYQPILLGFCVFALPMLVAAAPAKSDLQCETLSENNVLCAGGGAAEAPQAAKVAEASGTKTSGMLTRTELSGGALDLANEFELNTVLGDRTAVPEDPRFSSLAAGQKATGSVRELEVMMQAAGRLPGNGKIGIAAKK